MDEEFPEEGFDLEAVEPASPSSGAMATNLGQAAYEAHKKNNAEQEDPTLASDNESVKPEANQQVPPGSDGQVGRPDQPHGNPSQPQGPEGLPEPAEGRLRQGSGPSPSEGTADSPAAGGTESNRGGQGKKPEQFTDNNAGGPRGAKGGEAPGGAQARPAAGGTNTGGMGGAENAAGQGADAAGKGAEAAGKGAEAAEGAADVAGKGGGAGKADMAKHATRVAEGAKEEGAVGATDAAVQGAAVTAANAYGGPVAGAATDAVLQTEIGQQTTRLVTYGVLAAVVVIATVLIMMMTAAISGIAAILSVKSNEDQLTVESLSCTANGVPSLTDPDQISVVKEIMKAAATKKLSADAAIIPVMVGITESQLDPSAIDPLQDPAADPWTLKVGIYQWKPKDWASQTYIDSNDIDGAVNELRDPYKSALIFYDAFPADWETKDPWIVAKAVQSKSTLLATDYLANLYQAQATVASVLITDPEISASLGTLSSPTSCSGPTIGVGTGSNVVAPLVVISANIRQGLSDAEWKTAVSKFATYNADLVAIQEAYLKPASVYTPAGYESYRLTNDKASPFSETPVLWRTDRWTKKATGSIATSINDLHWGNRAVNWVTAISKEGHTVSVVSVHNLPNSETGERYKAYGQAMTALQGVVRNLGTQGAVVLPGDYNVQFSADKDPSRTNWPRLKYAEVGVVSTYASKGPPPGGTGVPGGAVWDYVWYTDGDMTLKSQDTYIQSTDADHKAVVARFEMGGFAYGADDWTISISDWLMDRARYSIQHPTETCGGSCTTACQHIAGWVWGWENGTNEPTAKIGWYDMLAKGYAHPGDMNPPIGAVLYWTNGDSGHAAIYIGNGYEQSNYPAVAGAIDQKLWRNVMPSYYAGWALPVYPAARTVWPPKA